MTSPHRCLVRLRAVLMITGLRFQLLLTTSRWHLQRGWFNIKTPSYQYTWFFFKFFCSPPPSPSINPQYTSAPCSRPLTLVLCPNTPYSPYHSLPCDLFAVSYHLVPYFLAHVENYSLLPSALLYILSLIPASLPILSRLSIAILEFVFPVPVTTDVYPRCVLEFSSFRQEIRELYGSMLG